MGVTWEVPQESISGPTLYNIFTTDTPISKNGTDMIQFTDDILIFSSNLRPNKTVKAFEYYLVVLGRYYTP